jgi:hypothetical protein
VVPIIGSAATSFHKIRTGGQSAPASQSMEIAVRRERTVACDSDRARFGSIFLSGLIAWPGCTSAFPGYKAMGSDWRGDSYTGSCLLPCSGSAHCSVSDPGRIGGAGSRQGALFCPLSSPLLSFGLVWVSGEGLRVLALIVSEHWKAHFLVLMIAGLPVEVFST